MKILIAEDDNNSRQLLETVLVAQGYEVISVNNGIQALKYLQNETVDLIISDILMPDMDGYGLCRAVKQDEALQDLPFIFYTATYTSPQDERLAMSLGASRFLIKPMLMDELVAVVASVLQEWQPEEEVELLSEPLEDRSIRLTRLDLQHAERVRAKLDKKLIELNQEKQKLIASEARFRDFAEASADWFWECDRELNICEVTGGPAGLNFYKLTELAEACYSHTALEMVSQIKAHKRFNDYVVRFNDEAGKLVYFRVSGKPVFNKNSIFEGYRGVGRDVTENVTLNRRVEFLASYDDLTGLPNRAQFRQRLELAIGKSTRNSQQVLLMFFDLDHFKMVNDTLGHEAGDALLVEATKRISEKVRATDALCRLGGDEFVLVMEGASPQDGHRLVRDIIAAFATPFDIQGQRVYCTVSIGVSVYPDDTTDPQTLLVYADLAMYRAKQNGRNDFEFYTNNLNFIAHQWLEMEHGLRQALKENQLFLVYQPQIENTNNTLVGMEALIRWRHPERGLIPPLEFIQIAEQSSLINNIGDWVMNEVCRQIREWLDLGLHVPRVSINISARHLRATNLSKTLNMTPAKYQIPPALVCIEITEHALLEEIEIVKENMQFIKEAGYQISLDDFGMGHSSLLYLKRWAVNEVKIDRSFIDGLVYNEDDRVIVRAIVALSEALGLDLVAEGIENQSQADMVKQSGCKQVQGFFYSQPLHADEMAKWLKK